MKKVAKRHPESPFHVVCPFCGFACTKDTAYSWCSGCYVEYYPSKSGLSVIFDTERKDDRFIWAKALQKAGGMRFGNLEDKQEGGHE